MQRFALVSVTPRGESTGPVRGVGEAAAAMLLDYFVEWMLDSTLDRALARPIPELARLRRLAALESSPELDAWLGPLRQRGLARFPQADWLIVDGLRRPEWLAERLSRPAAPFAAARQKTRQFCFWAAWAGRFPPSPSVFEMGQVLGAFLASGPSLEPAYEGSGGLLRLVDQLRSQSSSEDRRKLLDGLGTLLDQPGSGLKGKVARKLRGLAADSRLLEDLLGQLAGAV